MSWQPLVYWYGKEGFEDVTNAVDQALHKLPEMHSVQQVLSVQQDLKPDVCPMEIMHGMMHRH